MSFKLEQFKNHPQRGQIIAQLAATPPPETPAIQPPAAQKPAEQNPRVVAFTVPGKPVPKPRMTQSDSWRKRKCVLRYREYCDRIRQSAGPVPENPDALAITAFTGMAESWSQKTKAKMVGMPHRQKPDADNLLKAVADALFKDDSGIWDMHVKKFWAAPGHERTEITVLYKA